MSSPRGKLFTRTELYIGNLSCRDIPVISEAISFWMQHPTKKPRNSHLLKKMLKGYKQSICPAIDETIE